MCLSCSGSVLRGDAELYKTYAYLVLLRLSELGVEQFRCWFVVFTVPGQQSCKKQNNRVNNIRVHNVS